MTLAIVDVHDGPARAGGLAVLDGLDVDVTFRLRRGVRTSRPESRRCI